MDTFGRLILTVPGKHDQEFSLAKKNVLLGRAATNDVVLNDPKISRVHASIQCGDSGCTILDHGSSNGIRVNGNRVERALLAPGDVITLGDRVLRFELGAPNSEHAAAAFDSEYDLDATLAQQTMAMKLNDTHMARVVVHTPTTTWEVPLAQDALIIGRDPKNDIVINHPQVSRRHACIERRRDLVFIRDLGSTNGTWVNSQRVEEHVLRDGVTVRIGNANLVWKSGFVHEDLTMQEAPHQTASPGRRPVVVIPGAMGSDLWLGSERLWPNVKNLFTHPEMYRLPDDHPVEARGLVDEMVIVPNLIKLEQYGRLGDYLEEGLGYERGKDLYEFAYDWRQDNRLSAKRLAQAIEAWHVEGPITIVAHSMGCMVARYYVECLGGSCHVERLILIGGPHSGGAQALGGLLYGQGVLPFGLMGERLREVLITLPAVYQVLPAYPCIFDQDGQPVDIYTDQSWLDEKYRPLLRAAHDFRRDLGTRSSVPCVSIFGYGLKTVTCAKVQRDTEGRWEKVDFTTEPAGDTTIPEASAVVEGSEIHPVHQYHGSLYVDSDVKMRLRLELTRPHVA